MKKLLIFMASLFSANVSSQTEFDLDRVLIMGRQDTIVMEIDAYLKKKVNIEVRLTY